MNKNERRRRNGVRNRFLHFLGGSEKRFLTPFLGGSEKRFLTPFLLLIFGCGGGVTPQTSTHETIQQESAFRILAFGDSLTAGKDLEDPDSEAWPALIEKKLRAEGLDITVENSGVSGNTTFDALDRLEFNLKSEPDIVIVCLGSNDAFQGKPLRLMEENLVKIIERCRETGANVILVELKTFPNFGPQYSRAYEEVFPRVVEKTGATLAPFLLDGVAGDPKLNLSGGIHPNAMGHRRAAENLYETVKRAVKEKNYSR